MYNNVNDFVHCIWYCITGTRLEQIEIDTLIELSRIYKSNSIKDQINLCYN